MIVTSFITILGSATLVNYLSEPLTEEINITAPISFEHSLDGTTWTNDPIVFNGHSGDTINFDVRLMNTGHNDIPATILATISCVEGLTVDDFQCINATYEETEMAIKPLFEQHNETTLMLSYNVIIGHEEIGTKTYLASISLTLATNAVGHYKINSQVLPV